MQYDEYIKKHKHAIAQVLSYIFVLLSLLAYWFKWNCGGVLTHEKMLECYGQVWAGNTFIGSGFFLEDISGFKRAFYFVTNEHVRREAIIYGEKEGVPIHILLKDGRSKNAIRINLGTVAFSQFGKTDIVSIPIFSPLYNRILFGCGYRFVRLDRDFAKARRTRLSKQYAYLVSSLNYEQVGITNQTPLLAFHHIPRPSYEARLHEPWTNIVQLGKGHILSMPILDGSFHGYQPSPQFRLICSVIPGDSGSLVFHEEKGVVFAYAVINGMPVENNGQDLQAGPPYAISSDVVIASIKPPTAKSTVKALAKNVSAILFMFVGLYCFLRFVLFVIWPRDKYLLNKIRPQ